MRPYARMFLACLLWPVAALAADATLDVRTHPNVSPAVVSYRASGADAWQHGGDMTPCQITVPAGTYDIKIEAREDFFHVLRGEKDHVTADFEHPVVELAEELDWGRAFTVTAATLALVFATVLLSMRKRQRQEVNQLQAQVVVLEQVIDGAAEASARAMSTPLLTGKLLTTSSGSGFRVVRLLAQGGMGAVYEVMPVGTAFEGRWAAKMMKETGSVRTDQRFRREVEMWSRLFHPNIVRIQDWGVTNLSEASYPFIIMELIEGSELANILRQEGEPGLSQDRVVPWTCELLAALKTIHHAGIVHRDLKPGNLMITDQGRLKVMDFGISHRIGSHSITGDGGMNGTPAYMSPEHFGGQTTPASDMWSVGIILYEVLSGRKPYQADAWTELLGQILTTDPPALNYLVPELSPDLVHLVADMMHKEAEHRPTAEEALERLRSLLVAE